MAYQVATKIDSRTILDMNGAEQLLGRGDMLFLPGGMPKPIRIQNAFITSDEVEEITKFIYLQEGYSKRFFLPSMFEKKSKSQGSFITDLDDMFDEAARLIVRHQQGSVSLLQRRLKLGYARAARIVDQLEQAGVVGPSEGSKAREVLVENEEQLDLILRSL
jgi:S-DNA-T family DNA segregation ATPase FtsK/SpoIIIE